jgi:hypothetical protein
MSTKKWAQSVYRGGTAWGDRSSTPPAARARSGPVGDSFDIRIEHPTYSPLGPNPFAVNPLAQNAHRTAPVVLKTESASSYAGLSRVGRGAILVIVDGVDETLPTPSESVDARFWSLIGRSVKSLVTTRLVGVEPSPVSLSPSDSDGELAKSGPQQIAESVEDQIASQVRSPEQLTEHVQHLRYLARVSTGERALITPATAELSVRAWHQILTASRGQMPVPAACTGPDGQMLYAWDHGRHHLELEIFPDRAAEFFYKDRETRELWGEDYSVGGPLPDEALKKVKLFI